MPATTRQRPLRHSGFTLIEIMIAMVIGLVLTGGVVQIFTSVRQTNRVHEDTARMQETGRMALEILSRDIRMADFWGCANNISNVVNNLYNGGSGYIDFDVGGVDGLEGAGGAPDTLILRGGFDRGLQVQPPYGPQPSATIFVPPDNGLELGDIIMVSDCGAADIFQISNANADTAGTIVHNSSLNTDPGNYNATNPGCPGANAHCLSKVYGADASLFSVQQVVYTVATGSEGEPALFRNNEEFLDGVEDFQVLYGEDTNGTGVPNYYVPADQVADMKQVISIRFAVVTRSYNENLTGGIQQAYTVLGDDRTAPDDRLRQVYTSTIAVRNRL